LEGKTQKSSINSMHTLGKFTVVSFIGAKGLLNYWIQREYGFPSNCSSRKRFRLVLLLVCFTAYNQMISLVGNR